VVRGSSAPRAAVRHRAVARVAVRRAQAALGLRSQSQERAALGSCRSCYSPPPPCLGRARAQARWPGSVRIA
jgi:hypothetical protein